MRKGPGGWWWSSAVSRAVSVECAVGSRSWSPASVSRRPATRWPAYSVWPMLWTRLRGRHLCGLCCALRRGASASWAVSIESECRTLYSRPVSAANLNDPRFRAHSAQLPFSHSLGSAAASLCTTTPITRLRAHRRAHTSFQLSVFNPVVPARLLALCSLLALSAALPPLSLSPLSTASTSARHAVKRWTQAFQSHPPMRFTKKHSAAASSRRSSSPDGVLPSVFLCPLPVASTRRPSGTRLPVRLS